MLRTALSALAVVIAAVAASPAFAQSQTIRIEPRPYYGAVVTLEQGVRVWRPLPPTSHMIINPTGAPVNLSVADIRETVTSNNYVHAAPAATGAGYGSSYVAPGPVGGRYLGRPGHRQHGHRRPVRGLGFR